jgi:hypothetical protein
MRGKKTNQRASPKIALNRLGVHLIDALANLKTLRESIIKMEECSGKTALIELRLKNFDIIQKYKNAS